MLAQYLLEKCDGGPEFVRIEVVHLVQDEEQPGQLAMRQLEEFHLDLGDRRVRRDHEERRIALRQEIDRRLSIVAER